MLETISEIFREGYKRGWISARDGNASLRYREQEHLFITPSGVRKQFLQPEMFKKVRVTKGFFGQPPQLTHTFDVVQYTPLSEQLKPSGEYPLHYGLQQEIDSDIRVVIHMHPTYTVAAMYKGIDLQKLVNEFPELGRYTSVGPTVPEVAPISQELADATIRSFDYNKTTGKVKHDIVGIDRHGVVAVDTSPYRAFEHIERLEHICKIVLAAK